MDRAISGSALAGLYLLNIQLLFIRYDVSGVFCFEKSGSIYFLFSFAQKYKTLSYKNENCIYESIIVITNVYE